MTESAERKADMSTNFQLRFCHLARDCELAFSWAERRTLSWRRDEGSRNKSNLFSLGGCVCAAGRDVFRPARQKARGLTDPLASDFTTKVRKGVVIDELTELDRATFFNVVLKRLN
jgi:hypothetical protein